MSSTRIQLRDAVVAVTGAARGIGRATAELFLHHGATVCLADIDGDVVADVSRSLSPRAHPFQVDVSDEQSFAAFLASAEEAVGPLDVLVNNAGVMPVGRFLEEPRATTDAVFAVNFGGAANGMRLALPGMIERRRGHIVNVASLMGKVELPGMASYTASKAAVLGLSGAVREEIRGSGVSITVVLPGVVDTELSSGISIPLTRFMRVSPDDVAQTIVDSCRSRAHEVAIPRWMGLVPMLRPFVPQVIEDLVRMVIGDDRALTTMDLTQRLPYVQRLGRVLSD